MRRAIALAVEARARGDGAFGAVLLSPDGSALAEAGNAAITTGDPTAHAEMAAIRASAGRHSPGSLAGATLYASTTKSRFSTTLTPGVYAGFRVCAVRRGIKSGYCAPCALWDSTEPVELQVAA